MVWMVAYVSHLIRLESTYSVHSFEYGNITCNLKQINMVQFDKINLFKQLMQLYICIELYQETYA
jgi:hypothetical protein